MWTKKISFNRLQGQVAHREEKENGFVEKHHVDMSDSGNRCPRNASVVAVAPNKK